MKKVTKIESSIIHQTKINPKITKVVPNRSTGDENESLI